MAGRKGAIAFGLVYIPVELFTATQDDAVRFNQLAKDSMKRVRYVKTCPDCKRELKPEDIVKGYQYEKGKYVVVDDEELDAIKTDADRAMKIVQFSDHSIAPAKAAHFHIFMGDDSQEETLKEMDNWPTYYPASMNKEEVATEMLAH